MGPVSTVRPMSPARPGNRVTTTGLVHCPAGGAPRTTMTDDADDADPDTTPVDDFASDVLDTVDAIPPGHAMSYGDIAEYLGRGGPRQVGRVMATCGGAVPWWRVIHADGSLLAGHERSA